MPPSNSSNNKVVWYLVSTLTLIVLAVVGAWATTQATAIDRLQDRVTSLEKQYESIEGKLDLALEMLRGRR